MTTLYCTTITLYGVVWRCITVIETSLQMQYMSIGTYTERSLTDTYTGCRHILQSFHGTSTKQCRLYIVS